MHLYMYMYPLLSILIFVRHYCKGTPGSKSGCHGSILYIIIIMCRYSITLSKSAMKMATSQWAPQRVRQLMSITNSGSMRGQRSRGRDTAKLDMETGQMTTDTSTS